MILTTKVFGIASNDTLQPTANIQLIQTASKFSETSTIMSALADRDVNAQPTSNPANTDKQATAGEENTPKGAQQQKHLLKEIAENIGYAEIDSRTSQ